MDQYLSHLAPHQVREIIGSIGQERLTAYLGLTRSPVQALALYQANGRLAKHMHELVGGLEIALRNQVSNSLTGHYKRDDWYRCRALLMQLGKERRQNIKDIRDRLNAERRDERTGRIVAGLSFHFWVSLHENKYRDTVWTPHLHRIWPQGENIKQVHKDLLKARDLRNRIAHHEPIFRTVWHDRVDLIWLRFEQLAPATAAWYRSRLDARITGLRGECATLLGDRPS